MSETTKVFVDEIFSDLSKTSPATVKQIDYVALATMIMEIIKFLVNLWKTRKTVTETDALAIQAHARNLGFFGRAIVKLKLRNHMKKYSKDFATYQKLESEAFNSTVKKIGMAQPTVMLNVLTENISG